MIKMLTWYSFQDPLSRYGASHVTILGIVMRKKIVQWWMYLPSKFLSPDTIAPKISKMLSHYGLWAPLLRYGAWSDTALDIVKRKKFKMTHCISPRTSHLVTSSLPKLAKCFAITVHELRCCDTVPGAIQLWTLSSAKKFKMAKCISPRTSHLVQPLV